MEFHIEASGSWHALKQKVSILLAPSAEHDPESLPAALGSEAIEALRAPLQVPGPVAAARTALQGRADVSDAAAVVRLSDELELAEGAALQLWESAARPEVRAFLAHERGAAGDQRSVALALYYHQRLCLLQALQQLLSLRKGYGAGGGGGGGGGDGGGGGACAGAVAVTELLLRPEGGARALPLELADGVERASVRLATLTGAVARGDERLARPAIHCCAPLTIQTRPATPTAPVRPYIVAPL